MARARVHTLAKCEQPLSFSDGRPITIFGATYRLWASIVALEVLRHWSEWLPDAVAGSIPGRSSRDIAYRLQSAIEEALSGQRPLGGFSVDITKAFNQLPRPPIVMLLKKLRVPPELVDFWHQFLQASERLPLLAGGLGAPIGSTTGAPEGDPMAVVAMAAVCWMMAQKNIDTGSEMLTFVDNFSWFAGTKGALESSLCLAQRLCRVLRLPIDWNKSFAWSTCPKLKGFWDVEAKRLLPARATLRRVSDAKDLGVWFQFQARRRQTGPDKRLEEGKMRLDNLRKQPRALSDKVRLLLGGVWPQLFYGMEARVMPKATLDMIRSRAARALTSSGPSQSPVLVLSGVAPALADPEVYMMVQSAAALRRAFTVMPQTAHKVLQMASSLEGDPTVIGPATALYTLFTRNEWVISPDGWCYGPGMYCFSLKVSSRSQLSLAIQKAWNDNLHTKIEHRNGLHNLGSLSGHDTALVVESLPGVVQRTAANCVAGGHMSAAARSQWDPLQEPHCPYCGQPDTKMHRVFYCPAFDVIRKTFQPMLDWVCEHAGHWAHAACIQEHPDMHVVQLLFRARPCVPPAPLKSQPYQGVRVLYTDGTCTVPQTLRTRHAAWAVVEDAMQHVSTATLVAYYQSSGALIQGFHVVAQGLVPREQTIGRAEIVAALQACMLAQAEPAVTFHVHIDSSYALSFLEKLGRPAVQQPATDRDLCEWTGVWNKPPNLLAFKVKSHADVASLQGPAARHALGNSVADAAAARQADAPFLYKLPESIEQRQNRHRDMLRAYFTFQHECCKHVTRLRQQMVTNDEHAQDEVLGQSTELSKWFALGPSVATAMSFPPLDDQWLEAAPWPPWYVSQVWRWASALRWPPEMKPSHQLDSVSHMELLCDFMATTGVCPPLPSPDGQGTVIPVSSTAGKLLLLSIKDLVITLAASLKYLSKVAKVTLIPATAHRKVPSLQTLGCHAARRGFVPRPQLVTQEGAGTVLLQLLSAPHPAEFVRTYEVIREAAYGPDSEVHQRWQSLTVHQKESRRRLLSR